MGGCLRHRVYSARAEGTQCILGQVISLFLSCGVVISLPQSYPGLLSFQQGDMPWQQYSHWPPLASTLTLLCSHLTLVFAVVSVALYLISPLAAAGGFSIPCVLSQHAWLQFLDAL